MIMAIVVVIFMVSIAMLVVIVAALVVVMLIMIMKEGEEDEGMLTVPLEVRKRPVLKPVRNPLPSDRLLPHTSDHLRNVDERACKQATDGNSGKRRPFTLITLIPLSNEGFKAARGVVVVVCVVPFRKNKVDYILGCPLKVDRGDGTP